MAQILKHSGIFLSSSSTTSRVIILLFKTALPIMMIWSVLLPTWFNWKSSKISYWHHLRSVSNQQRKLSQSSSYALAFGAAQPYSWTVPASQNEQRRCTSLNWNDILNISTTAQLRRSSEYLLTWAQARSVVYGKHLSAQCITKPLELQEINLAQTVDIFIRVDIFLFVTAYRLSPVWLSLWLSIPPNK